jgi:phosphoglycerate kinase
MMLWYRTQSSRFNNYYCTIFPTAKCFGLLLAKEIESLNKVLKNSEKPVTVVLWSKVSSKITVIENILDKVDHMIIGGGMTLLL